MARRPRPAPDRISPASTFSRSHCGRSLEPLERRVLLSDVFSLVKDINDASIGPTPDPAHPNGPINYVLNDLTPVGGKAFFTADRIGLGWEL